MPEPRDPGETLNQPFVESGVENGVRCYQIDLFEPGHASEQVIVGGPERVWFGRPIGNRDDEVPERTRLVVCNQPLAEPMLIQPTTLGEPSLVRSEGNQKLGLPEQTTRAATELDARLEIAGSQTFEAVDRAAVDDRGLETLEGGDSEKTRATRSDQG